MSFVDSQELCQIAREASQVIQRYYAGDFTVDYKSPGDPVTDADRDANQLICARLAKSYPGVAIVAEESDPEAFADFRRSERIFFVDPLDGTREFVARNGQFVVMIGAVEGDQAVAGVVCAPAEGRLWVGERDEGAFRVEADGSRHAIRVAPPTALAEAQVMISRSRRSGALSQALQRLGVRAVPMGSAGLKGAWVAEGSAHAYLSLGKSGKLWDACAVHALVMAAGGKFTDSFGEVLDYRSPKLDLSRGILAAGKEMHAQVCEALQA